MKGIIFILFTLIFTGIIFTLFLELLEKSERKNSKLPINDEGKFPVINIFEYTVYITENGQRKNLFITNNYKEALAFISSVKVITSLDSNTKENSK